jgi:hypothetical protein
MVYKELMLLDLPNENRKVENRRKNIETPCGPRIIQMSSLLAVKDYPIWFGLGFMGPAFLAELSTKFYFESKFTLQHPGELKHFLAHDRFKTSCKHKPYEHVRSLEISITLQQLSLNTGKLRHWASPRFREPLQQHCFLSRT